MLIFSLGGLSQSTFKTGYDSLLMIFDGLPNEYPEIIEGTTRNYYNDSLELFYPDKSIGILKLDSSIARFMANSSLVAILTLYEILISETNWDYRKQAYIHLMYLNHLPYGDYEKHYYPLNNENKGFKKGLVHIDNWVNEIKDKYPEKCKVVYGGS